MTCIVGLIDGNNVFIGGDSAGYYQGGNMTRPHAPSKVWRRTLHDPDGTPVYPPVVMGFTGTLRVNQVIRYHLKVRAPTDMEDLDTYMVKEFAEAVRSCLQAAGQIHHENGTEESTGALMVGMRNRLYVIYRDFSVDSVFDPFEAIGSGGTFALGALAAMGRSKPQNRIKKALDISARFCPDVLPPYVIESVIK